MNLVPELSTCPSPAQIDDYVHEVIDLHFMGQIDEPTTRRHISGAVYASRVPQEVAATRTDLPPQIREDLADSLRGVLTAKVFKPSFFSLSQCRASSFCGWARSVARSAVLSELRNASRGAARNGLPADLSACEAGQSLVSDDAYASTVNSAVTRLVENFEDRSRGMRETDRRVASAQTLCMGLGVPPALRPETMEDRDFCTKTLGRDRTIAFESLKLWSRVVVKGESWAVELVDGRLLALWDDYTEDAADELISRGPHVAHMLALAAVAPLPRPSKRDIQKFKTVVMAGTGRRDNEWRRVASSLVDAYIASEYEAVSQYATMTTQARQAAETGHKIARSRLDSLLKRAATHTSAPYGATPRRVLRRLSAEAEAALVSSGATASAA